MRRVLASPASRLPLVGRDLARSRVLEPARRRFVPLAVAGFVVAALAVAALRIDLIRVRYGLADAVSEERALTEERRVRVARLRAQRNPERLKQLAEELGFERPARILHLEREGP